MARAPIVVVATTRDARVERGERAGEGRVVRARGRGDAGARERRRDAPEARIDAHRRSKRRGEEHAVDPDRGSERTDVGDAGGWRGGGDDEDDAGIIAVDEDESRLVAEFLEALRRGLGPTAHAEALATLRRYDQGLLSEKQVARAMDRLFARGRDDELRSAFRYFLPAELAV